MITPTPYVRFRGVEIQGNLVQPVDWAAVVIADIAVTWGRESIMEHESPGSATVRLLAKARYSDLLVRPFGGDLLIGMRYTTPTGDPRDVVIFRGQVDTATVDWFRFEDGEPAFEVELTAPSDLARLERYTLLTGGTAPRQSAYARREWLWSQMSWAPGLRGLGGLNAFPYDVVPVDYTAETSFREAIEALYQTAGEFITWDAHTQRVEASGRYWRAAPAPHLYLTEDERGRVYTAPYPGGESMIDGGRVHMASATHEQRQAISAVYAAGYTKFLDEYEQNRHEVRSVPNGLADMRWDVQTLGFVDQDAAGDPDVSLAAAGALLRQLAVDVKTFPHPPARQRHTEGFASVHDLLLRLGCYEVRVPAYVMGSVYNVLAGDDDPPLHRPIGGTVRFNRPGDGGPPAWESELNLVPVPVDNPGESVLLGALNPTAPAPSRELRRNLVPNPDLTHNANDWSSTATAAHTAARVTDTARGPLPAGWAYRMQNDATGPASQNVQGPWVDVVPGQTYTFSVHLLGASNVTVTARVEIPGATRTNGATQQLTGAAGTDPWVRTVQTWTAPAGVAAARLSLLFPNMPAGAAVRVRGHMVEEGPAATAYFDGNTPATLDVAYAWTGAAGASPSVELADDGGFTYGDFHESMTLGDLGNAQKGL